MDKAKKDSVETRRSATSEEVSIARLITEAPSGDKIAAKCDEIKILLLKKNISYHNSALDPVSIFGSLTAKDQLFARINDKLNRIKNNKTYEDEGFIDAVHDLTGYLILLSILIDNEDDESTTA